MRPQGRTFQALSFTCTLDGLDHSVSEDGLATKTMGKPGAHTALCGHLIQAVALVSPPGPVCPRCRQRVTELRATSNSTRPLPQPRDARLRRLLDCLRTLTRPKLDGHFGRRPAGLTSLTPPTRRESRATVLARHRPRNTT
jgi:hypothetical protein